MSIYRAPTATWVPPTDWVLIGKTEPVDVPAGDQPIVVGPVPLSRDATSGRGGRLIAVIDQADDPAPPMPSSAGSAHPFDLNHNNIASRGFRVPGNIVQGAGISAIGEFDIGGLPDGEVFELLIEARVAASDQLLFEVEEDLGSTLNGIAGWATSPHWVPADGPMVMLPPRALPCIPLVVAMAAGMRTTARFKIEPGGDAAVGPYHIVVRQMLGGQEIGRISWDSVTNTDGDSYP